MKKATLLLGLLLTLSVVRSQNIAITDDNSYTADPSSMLDVKSLTKGMLVPRMTTVQRTSISTPANGLLVYDTTINGFFYYNGASWINLSSGSASGIFWSYSSPNIYMTTPTNRLGLGTSSPGSKLHVKLSGTNITDGIRIETSQTTLEDWYIYMPASDNLVFRNDATDCVTFEKNTGNVGIGTTTPGSKLIVKGNSSTGLDEAIFAVQNQNGDTVFAVYQEGVRIWVDDTGGSKANGSRGGFAVGGFNPTKAGPTNEYLRVTPDSVRVYINDDYVPAKANGSRGGFAVGGYSPTKGSPTDHYLFVQDDSTRVYVADSLEGFGVENIQAATDQRIMRLNTENYFIGHESGINTVPGAGWLGKYNTFFGYKAGYSNQDGFSNVFIGYNAGYSNTGGEKNTFLGEEAGYYNTDGFWNVFLGESAGRSNTTGNVNIFVGQNSGSGNQTGGGNVSIGENAGRSDIDGNENVYIGKRAGMEMNGNYNVMIGSEAGGSNYLSGTAPVSNSIYIGRRAGFGTAQAGSSNNILIGNDSDISADDCILIGNLLSSSVSNILKIDDGNDNANPLIYGQFTNDLVGINDATPTANLHIKQVGTNEEGLAIENDGNTNTWSWEVGTNDLQLFYNGTYVGYWNDADGTYNATSDLRLKKDIEVVNESLLTKIMGLELVNYRLLHAEGSEQKTIGFIAQDVQKLFPELVKEREDGFLSLNYDDFGIISIKAIQEQQMIIDTQNEKITELENLNLQLLERIEIIEASLNKK